MARLGTDGFVWTTVVCHVAIAMFLVLRLFQFRQPFRARPWTRTPWRAVCSTYRSPSSGWGGGCSLGGGTLSRADLRAGRANNLLGAIGRLTYQ